ncbi:chemotaxis-specific protein-glutamate methyltransferase CheB [Thermoclostridium stercorarium]|uniref:chemotaxis-specific protein-glutamate methyltransferase CheB n=1 Tax=Thermoclostridium stercorarium TaxID=1510 RepID=UPI0004B48F7C|nr:chemotaxis-specific protein-glutamate methyltransferase CheB [Thermoclostridium stercorarium]UZQ85815.1 chemotaxis-specific protein-glutamate methyltransferase CheB [Thermoclostridium stercorarium]
MIKVLIVDDSSFMRVRIRTLLETCSEIKVVGIARNGMDAVRKTVVLRPDVITMDINMPDMSGIEAVELIMKQCPTPIIMVSSLSSDGANETLEALEKGAVDYIHKDNLNEKNLIEKILIAKNAKLNINGHSAPKISKNIIQETREKILAETLRLQKTTEILSGRRTFSIIGIGISTGGPSALAKVLPQISAEIPASIVIAQHMPSAFTGPLAERLNRISALHVKEAENGEQLIPGYAYICPGGKHIMVEKKGIITLYDREKFPNYHYCPSASLLMASISRVYANNAMCIIMTGMGSDGLEGVLEAKKNGSYVIAQSENSSVIFGMPKAIISNNLQDEIVHLDHIADRINELCLE